MADKAMKKRGTSINAQAWRRLKKSRTAMAGLIILCLLVVVAVFAPLIAPYDYAKQDLLNALQFPSFEHLLGTDQYGRDVLSRIIYGSRYSMLIGICSTVLAAVLGALLGCLAAYYKKLDNPIMRVMDVFSGIPPFLLCIVIAATLGIGLDKIIFAIGIASVPSFARIVRSSVLTLKDAEYVEAAVSIGADDRRILMKHIFPNAFAPMLVQFTLKTGNNIMYAATLSFIGLGLQPPTPEWGCMLSEGRSYIMGNGYLTTFPGLAIMITTYALNMLGDGLRDAFDPKLKH